MLSVECPINLSTQHTTLSTLHTMSKKLNKDIVIIGGGMVGMATAAALSQAGISSAIIEAQDPARFSDKKFDGRTSAIAYGSRMLFEKIGIWKNMAKQAGEILDIRITDSNSPLFVHYDHKLVGDEPMGHIIENRYIRKSLMDYIKKRKNIDYIAPARYTDIDYAAHNVRVTLEDGQDMTAKLLIAADGRNSKIREKAGIKTTDMDYGQVGIVCTAKHEKHHNGVAVENFLPAGPFAILPMHGGCHSSLVWTEKAKLAPLYMEMDDAEFTAHMRKRFGNWLGEVELAGDRWSYPVALKFAGKYIAPRMCLVGDAAHAIHPIAGQGLNLGLRDVAVLAELLAERRGLGLDIGGETVLKQYQKMRKFDNMQMIAITDILNRLFSNNIFPIKLARRLGLGAVNQLPQLKKIFMKHAMGV